MKIIQLISHNNELYCLTADGKVFIRTITPDNSFNPDYWQEVENIFSCLEDD